MTGATTPPEQPIRVVLADDAYVVRDYVAALLEAEPWIELVASCRDASELEQALASAMPDVVVTDIRMPPSGEDEGLRIARRLRRDAPRVGVVVLSQYAEPAYALSLLGESSSRRAYLLKERVRDGDELLGAIAAVARGGSVVDPKVVDALIEARSRASNSRLSALTPRERELLAQIAEGKSNAAIAQALSLTKRAVEKHVNSIFAKLDLPESQEVSRRVKAALVYLAEEDGRP